VNHAHATRINGCGLLRKPQLPIDCKGLLSNHDHALTAVATFQGRFVAAPVTRIQGDAIRKSDWHQRENIRCWRWANASTSIDRP
jgi:hypothetical protein